MMERWCILRIATKSVATTAIYCTLNSGQKKYICIMGIVKMTVRGKLRSYTMNMQHANSLFNDRGLKVSFSKSAEA
jgi:hypothetical protein